MKTYISILRGINVSGHRVIKMDALKSLYSELGFQNVRHYIQSGNVVFQYKNEDKQILANRIAKAIKESFNYDVPVIIIDDVELDKIIVNNPFNFDKSKDNTHFHITFLGNVPEPELIIKIKDFEFAPDEFLIDNQAIYLYCPKDYSNSKLTNSFFENKLKVIATTRNWKTVIQIKLLLKP